MVKYKLCTTLTGFDRWCSYKLCTTLTGYKQCITVTSFGRCNDALGVWLTHSPNVGSFGRSVVVITQNGPSNLFPVSIWQVTHSICSTSYMRAIRYIHFVFYRATGGFKRCDQHGMFNCERRGQLCHQWQKVVEQW